ncbi:hypothetical protein F443_03096 [Phytophthora nicotianae P1569]|uniref:RxLR effector protein n=1 Tax=Phytophthora nicotianae P1569 TaxID=1317065 RepID=V9FUH5_PHYNI|nr:hypothetical protein F443_03096 [Phytophthora nicotianae P1569]
MGMFNFNILMFLALLGTLGTVLGKQKRTPKSACDRATVILQETTNCFCGRLIPFHNDPQKPEPLSPD